MKQQTLYTQFKQWLAGLGFKLFIWGNDTTEENYWNEIYEQEKASRTPIIDED